MTRKRKPITLGAVEAPEQPQAATPVTIPTTPEPVQTAPEAPRKRAPKRPAPSEPSPTPQSGPKSPVEEAWELPYEPPSFHFDPSEDPMVELAARELCRRRLLPFIQRFRPKYMAGWVHEDICRRIERFVKQVERGESPRLLLMMPPRSGKSEIGSRHTPAWILGQHPDWEIIAGSHTSSLSMSFSRYLRDVMRDPAYTAVFPDARLDPSSQSVENWNLTGGGGYLAAGVGTGITGRGCFTRNTKLRSHTHSGMIPISTVRVGGYVYGYDHEKQEHRAVRVLAVSLSRSTREIYSVGDARCTDDHTFATSKNGDYVCAKDLSEGMPLVRWTEGQVVKDLPLLLDTCPAEHLIREGVPEVRREESWSRGDVQGVLHEELARGGNGGARLRHLLQKVLAKAARARGELAKVWGSAGVLLASVLPGRAEGNDPSRGLPGVWDQAHSVGSEKVLLSPVLPGAQEEGFHDEGVRVGVLRVEEAAAGAKGSGVRPVRGGDVSGGGASHRPQPGEQHTKELGAVMLSVSQVVSHTEGVSAGELEAYLDGADGRLVVDIQTETGNFFVGEVRVLAHNCHVLLLDDLVKDIEAADSSTIRDNTWEWYLSTAYTRLAPGGGVLGIMTWWHEDDWAGRIQEAMLTEDGDKFEIIKYPAINDLGDEFILPDDTIEQFPADGPPPPAGSRLTRRLNTAIHPARYTTEMMLRIKNNLVAGGQKRVWDALYQQNPIPDDGNHFTKEMFRYYGSAPDRRDLFIYQAWDFAITENQGSDYTVGVCIGVDHRDNIYFLDIRRFRIQDGGVIVDEMLDFYEMWQPELLGVEDGQIWKAIEFQFSKRCEERRLYPSHEALKPLTDKMVRASPLRGRMQLGKVFFDKRAPYFAELYKELVKFPAGKHDDQVDALSWAVRLTLTRAAPKEKSQPRPQKGWLNKLIAGTRGGLSHMAS